VVLVGNATAPAGGASVELRGYVEYWPRRSPTAQVLASGATDRWGQFQSHVAFGPLGPGPLELNVTWNGTSTSTKIFASTSPDRPRLEPPPAWPTEGFALAAVSDVSAVRPGDNATLRLLVLQDGAPIANTSVAFLAIRSEWTVLHAGNLTTDARGEVSLELRPASGCYIGKVEVYAWNETGRMAWTVVRPGVALNEFRPSEYVRIDVNGSTLGEPLRILATNDHPYSTAEQYVGLFLLPGTPVESGNSSLEEWQRAFAEINAFEKDLTDFGMIVLKFWLSISAEEQLRRFKDREVTPFKQYKLTEEDWRNRAKWNAYEAAACDMVQRSSTTPAPWVLVEAVDKNWARVKVLKSVCKALHTALG